MKTKFVCEKCNTCFETENECKKHEKCCQKILPIKGIFIGDDNENIKIKIIEYPTASLYGQNKIKLINNSYHAVSFEIDFLHLDDVMEYSAGIGIFTKDFSKDYEEKCIKRLIKRRNDKFNNLIKSLEDDIILLKTKMKNTDYEINRNNDYHYLISDFQDYVE